MSEEDQLEKSESIQDTARRILKLGPICDGCLGRQFAMLSTGLTDGERGRSIKTVMAMEASARDDKQALEDLAPNFKPARLKLGLNGEDARCSVCLGEMRWENQNLWADWAVRALKGFEYVTFLVGTKITGLLAENEELILAEGGSKYAEPLKSEMNREVGKLIAATTGKEVDFKRPDIVVHLNLESRDVELQVASVYVYGRYRKVVRGIPQTRWPCRVCHGQGCPRCEGTGRMYPESVDELIRPSVVDAFKAEDTVFHGAGREDIDARMLGTGRPFIVEAVKPKIRTVDMAALKDDINRIAQEKVEVSDLRFAEPQEVEMLKDAAFRKTYEALVDLGTEASEEKLKSVLKELVGSVDQRTPTRVSHRRSDKHRARNVYRAELQELSGKLARIVINGDSGLYIKELISGDEGRTRPSLAEVLGSPAKVLELDVVDVGGELNGTSSRNEEEDEI